MKLKPAIIYKIVSLGLENHKRIIFEIFLFHEEKEETDKRDRTGPGRAENIWTMPSIRECLINEQLTIVLLYNSWNWYRWR